MLLRARTLTANAVSLVMSSSNLPRRPSSAMSEAAGLEKFAILRQAQFDWI
jgi:hypothetical protein